MIKKILLILLFISLGLNNVNALVPQNGLVGEWLLDGNSIDTAGNNNLPTTNISWTSNTGLGTNQVAGFNSIGTSFLNLGTGDIGIGGDFTYSVWYNGVTIDGYDTLITDWELGQFNFYINASFNDGILLAQSGNGLSGNDTTYLRYTLTPGIWQHITYTRSGNTKKLYIDGILVDSYTGGYFGGLTGNLKSIGNRTSNSSPYGYMGKARIYNTALSDIDVLSLYNENTVSSCVNPVKGTYGTFNYYIANVSDGTSYYCFPGQDYEAGNCSIIDSSIATVSYLTNAGHTTLTSQQDSNNCSNTEFIWGPLIDGQVYDFFPPTCNSLDIQTWFDSGNAPSISSNIIENMSFDGGVLSYWQNVYSNVFLPSPAGGGDVTNYNDFISLLGTVGLSINDLNFVGKNQSCYAEAVGNELVTYGFYANTIPYTGPTDGINGTDGLNCWDLNGNGLFDISSEDINNDGIADALDCQGQDGIDGQDGFSCVYIGDIYDGVQGINGHQYSCDGGATTNVVWDGVDGLNGQDGFSCTLSGSTINCSDGSFDLSTLQGSDGYNCWDLNQDYNNDVWEDINNDGQYNVYDCRGQDGADGTLTIDGTGNINITDELTTDEKGFWGGLGDSITGGLTSIKDSITSLFTADSTTTVGISSNPYESICKVPLSNFGSFSFSLLGYEFSPFDSYDCLFSTMGYYISPIDGGGFIFFFGDFSGGRDLIIGYDDLDDTFMGGLKLGDIIIFLILITFMVKFTSLKGGKYE